MDDRVIIWIPADGFEPWTEKNIIEFSKEVFKHHCPNLILKKVVSTTDQSKYMTGICWKFGFASEKEQFLFRLANKGEELQKELELIMLDLPYKHNLVIRYA